MQRHAVDAAVSSSESNESGRFADDLTVCKCDRLFERQELAGKRLLHLAGDSTAVTARLHAGHAGGMGSERPCSRPGVEPIRGSIFSSTAGAAGPSTTTVRSVGPPNVEV